MSQKNIFTVIAAILFLQGIAFYFMGDQIMTQSFPDIMEPGHTALALLFELPAALCIAIGLITYANRTTPNVSWAFTVGSGAVLFVTLKHLLIDNIQVPIPAIAIQTLVALAFAYSWSLQKKV